MTDLNQTSAAVEVLEAAEVVVELQPKEVVEEAVEVRERAREGSLRVPKTLSKIRMSWIFR